MCLSALLLNTIIILGTMVDLKLTRSIFLNGPCILSFIFMFLQCFLSLGLKKEQLHPSICTTETFSSLFCCVLAPQIIGLD